MKILLIITMLLMSACVSVGTDMIDSAGQASKNAGIGIGAAKVGEGIRQLGKSRVEAQKSQQKITEKNTKKTEEFAKVVGSVKNEKDKVALAKQALISNEAIEKAREKTKQAQAENSGYSQYAIGALLGATATVVLLVFFAVGRNTRFSIG